VSVPYERTIRFADIDAAGFVFFAHYLAICHEAYEHSLQQAGIELRSYFLAQRTLLPITKTQAQYLAPLQSGERVRVELSRTRLSDSAYRLDYRLVRLGAPEKLAGLVQTEHLAIDVQTLERKPIPAALAQWLAAT
jgi:1,4-dihydroxy-2-naphthoyl-CoA hydrolase